MPLVPPREPLTRTWFEDRSAELEMKCRAREGIAEWLTMYSWTYFVTLTFRRRCDPNSALTKSLRFLKESGAIRVAAFIEPHQSGDPHMHGLVWYGDALPGLASAGQIASTTLCDLWFARPAGGLARASVVRNAQGAAHYVAKYVTKCTDKREFPWTLWGPAHAWRIQPGMREELEGWEHSTHSRSSRRSLARNEGAQLSPSLAADVADVDAASRLLRRAS